MKSTGLIAVTELLGLAGLASLASAEANGYLELGLRRESGRSAAALRRRLDGFSLGFGNDNDSWVVDVDIGTPAQTVKLAVDIGTYMTWVIDDCEYEYFQDEVDECNSNGIYNASLSSTNYEDYESFDLDFDTGSSRDMEYAADDFTIQGGSTLKNMTFGVNSGPNMDTYGYLGLGFGQGVNSNRSNFVDELVNQNVTQTKAFGLAIGTADDKDGGSLVLGGVDTKKFSGALQHLPILDPPDDEGYSEYRYWVNVDNVTLHGAGGNQTTYPGFRAVLRSHGEINYLPLDIVTEVAAAFGIYNISDNLLYDIPCSSRYYVNGSLDLQFGALNISIPYSDLISVDTSVSYPSCYLSTWAWDEPEGRDFYWLEPVVLRAVYAVFDQESRSVWMAKRNECGSDIQQITKDNSSISSMRGQCDGDGLSSSFGTSSGESSAVRLGGPTGLLVMAMLGWLLVC